MLHRLTALASLAACTTPEADPPDTDPAYTPPRDVTLADHAPLERLTTFPDEFHTEGTGDARRLRIGEAARTYLGGLLPEGFTLLEALEELDGFGATAGISLTFTAPIDVASLAASTRLLSLPDGTEHPVELEVTDEGRTAIFTPLFPLAPQTRHALLVDADLRDASGGEVWRSVDLDLAMRGELGSAPPALVELWDQAFEVAGLTPDDVAHGTVFTTQSRRTEDVAIVDALLARDPRLSRVGDCVTEGNTLRCEATLATHDVLGEAGWTELHAPAGEGAPLALEATVWLPTEGEGPWPVVIYGHGLGGDRYEARGDSSTLAAVGFAVVSIDAPRQGRHPRASSSELLQILEFFGISLETRAMDVRVLRDDFRLAAWEKLQLVEAIAAGFDADGDGDGDLDGTRIGYAGHSLGAVMGPQLVAMDPRVGSAYLSVPGGRVSEIVHRGVIFSPLVAALAPSSASTGDIDRFFPMLQTAIEPGDPLGWADLLLDGTRDVYVQQVIDDDIMPNLTTRALARALGVARIGEELQPVDGLAVHTGGFPVSGNVAGRTGALLQFSSFLDEGVLIEADHTDIFSSDMNQAQLRHWFATWRDTGVAEILAPLMPAETP